jgi:CRISPR-associated protein Csm4
VPGAYWKASGDDRKTLKKKRWLPLEAFGQAFPIWQSLAKNDTEAVESVIGKAHPLAETHAQAHNSINRDTATTGEGGMFAPYTQTQYWFHPDMRLDLYAVLDETRITPEELAAALDDIGKSGYGRDASIGLGKFGIERDAAFTGLPHAENANACLTLAPCAPQGLGLDAAKSFYQPLTRFGRHGDLAVHSGNPFKRPLLLAKTGSVFTPKEGEIGAFYLGQGLADVSTSRPEAVAQGYAPIIGIRMENAP